MMKVRILTNLGSVEFPDNRYLEGEEHEVEPSFGAQLVRRKLAVDITPSPVVEVSQPVIGVATEPELKSVPEESTQPKPTSAKPKKTGD